MGKFENQKDFLEQKLRLYQESMPTLTGSNLTLTILGNPALWDAVLSETFYSVHIPLKNGEIHPASGIYSAISISHALGDDYTTELELSRFDLSDAALEAAEKDLEEAQKKELGKQRKEEEEIKLEKKLATCRAQGKIAERNFLTENPGKFEKAATANSDAQDECQKNSGL